MQALELQAQIDEQHEVHLQLPDTVRAKTAKIIAVYEDMPEAGKAPKTSVRPVSRQNPYGRRF